MSFEPLLEIIDDLALPHLFEQACQLSVAKGWYFGHFSRPNDTELFWRMDLEGIVVFDQIWRNAQVQCETLTGVPLRLIRQYATGHTFGLGGTAHLDDHRPGTYTLLYYPMREWRDGWEGETVFYDEDGEVALAVKPRPNRGVLFDSRILHEGRAPGRAFNGLRVAVAYKLESALLAPVAADAPEANKPGPAWVREHLIRVPPERVRELIDQQLKRLGQTINLPGFRPGKIPAAVLEQHSGATAKTEAMKVLAREAVTGIPDGCFVAKIEASEDGTGVQFKLSVVNPREFPDPGSLPLIRLTGIDPALGESYLRQQVLDHLDRAYAFEAPSTVLEQEFAAILQLAKAEGGAGESATAELRSIAERRVRTGIIVAELARRQGVTSVDMEETVVNRLVAKAVVTERPATDEEIRYLTQ